MSDHYLDIISHYEVYDETNRLIQDHPLEFLRTAEIIERSLNPPPGVIVDIGGGPGVYAAWLAGLGYRVHLFDLVPRHVEAALRASDMGNLTAEIADARAVPMSDASADVVLLLGPLYHLVAREDRITALREAKRILRPGGTVFAAGISRFASAIDGMMRDLVADPAFVQIMERDLADGQHRNPTRNPGYFTTAYLHRPEELLQETEEAGFTEAGVITVEGLGWAVPDLVEILADGGARDRLLRILRNLEAEPALLGASPHLLAVARRR
ncbi:MAG: class I SAM-dependent methyltransferase [Acidimicrobiia bacterium]